MKSKGLREQKFHQFLNFCFCTFHGLFLWHVISIELSTNLININLNNFQKERRFDSNSKNLLNCNWLSTEKLFLTKTTKFEKIFITIKQNYSIKAPTRGFKEDPLLGLFNNTQTSLDVALQIIEIITIQFKRDQA